MTRIYLAAAFPRQEEMRGIRWMLHGLGHEVTSTWLDQTGGGIDPAAITPDTRGKASDRALLDLQDVKRADVFALFTDDPSTTGGFHWEMGYAFAMGRGLIVVGRILNIFMALPTVTVYPDKAAFLSHFGHAK